MVASTTEYFRYVDDFCFVCTDQAGIDSVTKQIKSFFRERDDSKVHTNDGKTYSYAIGEPEALLEHTAKLKYDLRFGVLDSLTNIAGSRPNIVSAQQRAERLFRGLFIEVEDTEDPTEIARKSAGFISTKLSQLIISRREAFDIAYGLLELGPARASSVRAVMSSLIALSQESPDAQARLREYLETAPPVIQSIFLQLIPAQSSISSLFIDLIQEHFTASPNWQVRSEAYYAIVQCAITVKREQIRSWFQTERSKFVQKYLLNCIRVVDTSDAERIWIELAEVIRSESAGLITSMLYSLRLSIEKGVVPSQILETLYTLSISWESLNSEAAFQSLKLLFRHGSRYLAERFESRFNQIVNSEILRGIKQQIIADTVRHLFENRNSARIFVFADMLADLGYESEAASAYQEIVIKGDDASLISEAKTLQRHLPQGGSLPGLPSWYTLDSCDRGLYCDLSEAPDYICRSYSRVEDGESIQGTLEIIQEQRVTSSTRFSSLDNWKGYLEGLSLQGIISLSQVELQSNSVSVIYSIPAGFITLSQWIVEHQYKKSQRSILTILSEVVEALERVNSTSIFSFYNVSPCNVLWNPISQKVMFLNIGSCLKVPKYACGVSGCSDRSHQTELGQGAGSYFLGLLTAHMFSQHCPLRHSSLPTVASIHSQSHVSANSEIFDDGLLPHSGSLISRMGHKSPEYRYNDLTLLKRDVHEILRFIDGFRSRSAGAEIVPDWTKKIVLVDFVAFRLRVILRNPQVSSTQITKGVEKALLNLSSDLDFYKREHIGLWPDRVTSNDSFVPLLSGTVLSHQVAENQNLIIFASQWQALLKEIDEKWRFGYKTELADLVVIWVCYSELRATISAILSMNSDNPQKLQECLQLLKVVIDCGYPAEKLTIRYSTSKEKYTCFPMPYTKQELEESGKVLSEGLQGRYRGHLWNSCGVASLTAIPALMYHACEIMGPDNKVLATSDGILKLSKSCPKLNDVFILLEHFPRLESLLENIVNNLACTSSTATQITVDRSVISNVLDYLRRIRPSIRVPAKLISYTVISSPKSGIIRLGVPPRYVRFLRFKLSARWWSHDIRFTESETYSVGTLFPDSHVHVDLVTRKNSISISGVFGLPQLFSCMLQTKLSIVDQLRGHCHTNGRRILFLVIGLAIALYLVDFQEHNQAQTSRTILERIFYAVVILMLILISGLIVNFIYDRYFSKNSKLAERFPSPP